jgi:hypothetical protein
VIGTVATGLWLLPALGVVGAFHVAARAEPRCGRARARASPSRCRSCAARRPATAAARRDRPLRAARPGWIDPINRSADHLRLRAGPGSARPAVRARAPPGASFEAWKRAYLKRPADFPRYFFGEDANATVLTYGSDDGVTLAVNTKPDASSFADPQRERHQHADAPRAPADALLAQDARSSS